MKARDKVGAAVTICVNIIRAQERGVGAMVRAMVGCLDAPVGIENPTP